MKKINVQSSSRTAFIDVTREVQRNVTDLNITHGVMTVFNPHTTAGLTINENADPDVVTDLTNILDRVVPWSHGYKHVEGNAAAHMKASIIGSSVQVIVREGHLQLGTWQSIYFCEFDGPRNRELWVSGSSE